MWLQVACAEPVATTDGEPTQAPATPVAVVPREALPVPREPPAPATTRWVPRDPSIVAALPPSRAAPVRAPDGKILVEVRPHPEHREQVRVVIDGHTIDDVRTNRERLTRWFNATYLAPGMGWDVEANGVVIAAAAEVDSDALAEIIVLATGPRLDGPVELALRRAGHDGEPVTAVPIVLAADGVMPMAGAWGTWAQQLDERAGAEPVALALGDVVGEVFRFRDRLEPRELVTRIVRADADAGLRSAAVRGVAVRHRNEVGWCYRSGAIVDPDLAGRWDASLTIDRSGHVTALEVVSEAKNERVQACLERALRRWEFPAVRAATVVRMGFDLSYRS